MKASFREQLFQHKARQLILFFNNMGTKPNSDLKALLKMLQLASSAIWYIDLRNVQNRIQAHLRALSILTLWNTIWYEWIQSAKELRI